MATWAIWKVLLGSKTGREEVDGEYLPSYGSGLSVELRGSGEWLPVEVRFNEKRDIFEGQDRVESTTSLEVYPGVILDLMCGIGKTQIEFTRKI